jgi:polyisoprenoid-binding protein YceI
MGILNNFYKRKIKTMNHITNFKSLPALLMLLAVALFSNAQEDKYADSYICQKGMIHFFSATAMENIDATTNTALCVLNTKTKKVYAKITQTSFVFKDKLMRDHFNENYMETDKFPTGILDMTIVEDQDFKKDGVYDVTLKGTLEMHGVKQEREIKGKLTIKNGQPVNGAAVFMVKLADHKIKIPSVVGANIAEDVQVTIDFNFEKFHK